MGFKIEDIVHPDGVFAAKQYECSICLCIVNEPVQTKCDHLFCAACIVPSEACPTCRTELGPEDCQPLATSNKLLLRFIHAVPVWCPYRDSSPNAGDCEHASSASRAAGTDEPATKRARGQEDGVRCDWTGTYDDLLAKHLSECPCHVIECPHGCGESVARRELTTHAATCAYNFIRCSICGELTRPDAMPRHNAEKAESHVHVLQEQLLKKDQAVEDLTSKLTMRIDELARTFTTRMDAADRTSAQMLMHARRIRFVSSERTSAQ